MNARRLNWSEAGKQLEEMAANGICPALIYDDNGHWALATDGIQNVPMTEAETDIATTFFVEAKDWCDDPKVAIARAWLEMMEEK